MVFTKLKKTIRLETTSFVVGRRQFNVQLNCLNWTSRLRPPKKLSQLNPQFGEFSSIRKFPAQSRPKFYENLEIEWNIMFFSFLAFFSELFFFFSFFFFVSGYDSIFLSWVELELNPSKFFELELNPQNQENWGALLSTPDLFCRLHQPTS